MIPQGYAAGEPKDNITINDATKYGHLVQTKLNQNVGGFYVNVTGSQVEGSPGFPVAQAIENGVDPEVDKINIVDTKGENVAQSAALLAPGTIESIIQWFDETLDHPDPDGATLNALADMPSVVAAVKSTMLG